MVAPELVSSRAREVKIDGVENSRSTDQLGRVGCVQRHNLALGGHKPVILVVTFLTPLSSNSEIKRIDRPTFLLLAPY